MGTFFGKNHIHGYLFLEKLPLNMGMGPEHITDQSKSENHSSPPPPGLKVSKSSLSQKASVTEVY